MITAKENPLIKETAKLISAAKARRKSGRFAAEGLRLCRDAVLSGARIVCFMHTPSAAEKYPQEVSRISSASERTEVISEALMKKLSDTETPQGFLCIISTDMSGTLTALEPGAKYVGLENIQDPSNLGTILRTAEALGADGVILSPDCCDIFSPKVVRGSMGAVFRLPFMISRDLAATLRDAAGKGIASYGSTPRDADDIQDKDFSGGGIMLIGNEGSGLRKETLEICSCRVKINMKGRAESLNASAAAAILMYRFI